MTASRHQNLDSYSSLQHRRRIRKNGDILNGVLVLLSHLMQSFHLSTDATWKYSHSFKRNLCFPLDWGCSLLHLMESFFFLQQNYVSNLKPQYDCSITPDLFFFFFYQLFFWPCLQFFSDSLTSTSTMGINEVGRKFAGGKKGRQM